VTPPPVAKLRLEKKGRGGKAVTVVYDLSVEPAALEELAREWKRALGTGGAVVEGTVELHGDRRERLREILAARGIRVKG
jgi:translation initiation factor 1